MPRKLRQEEAGAIFHVFARGNDRQAIFLDDVDRARYLELLGSTVARGGWLCLAYCLMDNHVHLLLETPKPNLGYGMQRVHGDYAACFNHRHGRVGHLFQGRFGATRIEDDAQLWMTVAYIARNPAEGGLSRGADDPWAWSSDGVRAGAATIPQWLARARLDARLAATTPGGYRECVRSADEGARSAKSGRGAVSRRGRGRPSPLRGAGGRAGSPGRAARPG